MDPGHWDGGGCGGGQLNQPLVTEQVVVTEAGVALPAVGVQDPEGRSPARWASPVPGDDHLRSLADHVPAEPDPRSTGQLQPDPRRLADGAGDAGRDAGRRLEDDEGDGGTARERGQPPQSIGESRFRTAAARRCAATRGRAATRRCVPTRGTRGTRGRAPGQPRRQVDDQQVHGAARQQRAGDGQALLGVGRGHDHQPLRLDPAGDRLDRVQRCGQVQPGDDRAGRLGLGREPQRQRRPATRGVSPDRHAHAPGHATGAQDRIELNEAGREDPVRIGPPAGAGLADPGLSGRAVRVREAARVRVVRPLHGYRRQRPDHLTHVAGRGRSPARPKGRECRAQVRRGSCHGRQYRTNVRMNQPLPGPDACFTSPASPIASG